MAGHPCGRRTHSLGWRSPCHRSQQPERQVGKHLGRDEVRDDEVEKPVGRKGEAPGNQLRRPSGEDGGTNAAKKRHKPYGDADETELGAVADELVVYLQDLLDLWVRGGLLEVVGTCVDEVGP